MNDLPTMDEALEELGIRLPPSHKLQCPNGTDKTASLHVYADSFYCFHCGKSGDGLGLIAMFTGQDIRRLFAQRVGGNTDRTRMRSDATKELRKADVSKAVEARLREIHNDWFRFLHDVWKDAPLWGFEDSIERWGAVFDDTLDRILGRNMWHDDGRLTAWEADKLIDSLEKDLAAARLHESGVADVRRRDEVRAEYWRRKRALVNSSVYESA